MNNLFFDSLESIIRIIVTTVLAYFMVILIIRTQGKRTLSDMNAFDFIVTIALGSVLAAVLLDETIALADGILAFFALTGLQYLVSFLAVRFEKVSDLIKGTPRLLLYDGKIIPSAMRKERITMDEIYFVLRTRGMSSISEVKAVVLETDGSLSVISKTGDGLPETLRNVQTKV